MNLQGLRKATVPRVGNNFCISLVVALTAVNGNVLASSVTLTVDATGQGRTISPYIYGINYPPSLSYIKAAGLGLIRWGSTGAAAYNWKVHATNKGRGWYFSNGKGIKHQYPLTPCDFLSMAAKAGSASILTLPNLGWVAKDTSSYSFSARKYGPQAETNPNQRDAGNGLRPDGSPVRGNDPNDAMVPAFPTPQGGEPPESVFMDEWVSSLRYNCRGARATFYAMDNEPEIWHVHYRNVHPHRAGYDEILENFLKYGSAVKATAADALVTGPVTNGWYDYWSAGRADDRATHGNADFLPWFLKQLRAHDKARGRRTLDVLDVHYYPSELFWKNKTDPASNALRLRATRSLWDPTYEDETSLGRRRPDHHQPNPARFMVIPRLQELLKQTYPGTRLGISEYNFGAGHTVNGGLAVAEVLGILGREGVYLAAHWQGPRGYPDQTWPSFQAFRLFRNADGKGAGFGNLSLRASSTDWDRLSIFAAKSQRGRALTLVLINKDPDQEATARVKIHGFKPASHASVYRLSAAYPSRVQHEPDLSVPGPTFNLTLPRYSASLLIVPSRGLP